MNLFLWRHELANSFLLKRLLRSFLKIMKYFPWRHRLHFLLSWYGLQVLRTLHLTRNDFFRSLRSQMYIYIYIFTWKSRDTLKSFTLFITVKTIPKLNPEHRGILFEIKIEKLVVNTILIDTPMMGLSVSYRRSSRSLGNAEFGHFTLLFCRGRQRNVPRIITHVHGYCSR